MTGESHHREDNNDVKTRGGQHGGAGYPNREIKERRHWDTVGISFARSVKSFGDKCQCVLFYGKNHALEAQVF